MQAWGMTETSPLGTAGRLQPEHNDLANNQKIRIRAKQGIEFPGIEMRIVKRRRLGCTKGWKNNG